MQRLAERSHNKNTYVFSDFLEEPDQNLAIRMSKNATIWGGADFCSRKMVRFGNAEELGYEQPFPLAILCVTPLNKKFAAQTTHRDVLGAIMNLGVAREKIGDIFASNTASYVVVVDTLAQYFVDNLVKVGKTFVQTTVVEQLPDFLAPRMEDKQISADSNRIDAIVARLFNLSREVSQELVADERVKINGEVVTKAMRPLKQGDTVSVRGYGKFRFGGESGTSRKGKTYFLLQVFS